MELTAAYRDIYKRPHSPGACHCATRDKLHATCRTRPEPRPLLYCLHDTRTWTTTASSVLCYSLQYAPCWIVYCIPRLQRMKKTGPLIEKVCLHSARGLNI